MLPAFLGSAAGENASMAPLIRLGSVMQQLDMDVSFDALGVLNSYNYWDELAFPNWITFTQNPSARNAFNLAYTLWHVLDWIRLDRRHGFSGASMEDIRDFFERDFPMLGVIHDVATLGKHAKVTRPRGGVVGITASITGAVMYFGPGGPRSEHPSEFTVTFSDGSTMSLFEVFKGAVEYWDRYFRVPRDAPASAPRLPTPDISMGLNNVWKIVGG